MRVMMIPSISAMSINKSVVSREASALITGKLLFWFGDNLGCAATTG